MSIFFSSVCAPDYAEVDTHSMATFYKRDLPCVLAPYATTTLINTPKQTSGSVSTVRLQYLSPSRKHFDLNQINTF